WAPLHDEHAVLRGADDLVLLTLDGGDDVAERAGAAAFERREQRGVAAQAVVVTVGDEVRVGLAETVVMADTEVPVAEQFVLEPEQLATFDGEVPAPQQPHRIAA